MGARGARRYGGRGGHGANPKLALTVDLYSDDWDRLQGVMVQGTARVIERGPRFRGLRRRLYTKYP